MTDDSPEVVAAADLTPLSPKPIHLSFPVVVPALQDQADILYTMVLSPTMESDTAPTLPVPQANVQEQTPIEPVVAQQPVVTEHALVHENIDTKQDQKDSDVNASVDVDADADAEAEAEVVDDDDYAKTFDSPVAEAVGDEEDDVSKANKSTDTTTISSDLVTSPSVVEAPSDKSSSTNIPSPAESKAAPEPSTQAETQAGPEPPQHQTERMQGQISLNEVPLTEETIETNDPATNIASIPNAVDIQAMVDTITAKLSVPQPVQGATATSDNSSNANLPNVTSSAALPPRPPTSQQPTTYMRPEDARRFQPGPSLPNAAPAFSHMPPAAAGLPYTYAAAPGTMAEVPGSHAPPHPAMTANPYPVMPMPQFQPAQVPVTSNPHPSYEAFQQDERKYVSEAKWDRFPEGSRLFIGNLSSERVQKREVFDVFAPYGRLAQISLKQAYGFVQYHTAAEGQAAMANLQGIEMGGRKIHLEFSRSQKKNDEGDRNRGNRGRGGGQQQNDRARADGRRRDDYRPRSPSPARGHHQRQSSYGRDRDRGRWEPAYERGPRARSRSPPPHPSSYGGYRRRSPSPYRRGSAPSEADLDIPRRYSTDVPDVQLLLLQEVDRDFINWVQRAFVDRGLKVDVMFLNPRFPRELVINRQVVEGVHAVSELDFRAQSSAKIPLLVFDRSAGRNNARFDMYQDLEPKIATELVLRAKSNAQLQQAPPGGYGYPPSAYPVQHAPFQPYPTQQPSNPAMGALGALGSLDSATLQRVLAAVQAPPQGIPQAAPGQPIASHNGLDLNSVLGALGNNPAIPQQASFVPSQPGQPGQPAQPQSNAESAQHVQNIMAQLARYRQ